MTKYTGKNYLYPLLLSIFALWGLAAPAGGRERTYSYIRYGLKDGLAGMVTHGLNQDQDGYIWIATETGLSRFDGTHFRNFTRADGLPSNEIFGTFVDSRNRVWITSFKNAVCYYYNGRIYNQQNDPLLRRVKLQDRVNGYAETANGDVVIVMPESTLILPADSSAPRYFPKEAPGVNLSLRYRITRATGAPSPLFVDSGLRSLLLGQTQRYLWHIYKNKWFLTGTKDSLWLPDMRQPGKTYPIATTSFSICRQFLDDSLLALSFIQGGIKLYDLYRKKFVAEYLPAYRVHDILKDREGNLWFSTKGMGLYLLRHPSFVSYSFGTATQPAAVHGIFARNQAIHLVAYQGECWKLPLNGPFDTSANAPLPQLVPPATHVSLLPPYQPVSYNDAGIGTLLNTEEKMGTVKTLFAYGDTLLIATSTGTYTLCLTGMRIVGTLFDKRATCAVKQGTVFYIGSLNGLYAFTNDSLYLLGNKFPVLNHHISALAADHSGTLWVATYEEGLVGYKDGQVIAHIHTGNSALSSDICRCLYIDGKDIWVGTEKGIDKLRPTAKGYRVSAHYDASDGLGSDIINAIYANGSRIYVGTQAGLTCFDEARVPRHSSCHLLITGISVAGAPAADKGVLQLPHSYNGIRFDYAGISFRSAGNIRYRYRLLGLNEEWQTTRETFLSYPTLPSGNYTLQLKAINKYGDESPLIEKHFTVGKTFWEYRLVQAAALILLLGGTIGVVQLRAGRQRKKAQQEQEVQKKMMELEQMGLRAQMNPHFIFNCLNSIQNYIIDRDIKGANFYLSRFAGLIRQTLEYASRASVPLSEEIDYLEHYLELEQMQMPGIFTFSITTQPGLSLQELTVPVMIIQPFVENAVKHGMRKKKNGGLISLFFRKNADILECVLTDNGPGILKKQGTADMNGHQPKGLSITMERIRIWNQLSARGRHITIHTGWASEEAPGPYGTKVVISFPV